MMRVGNSSDPIRILKGKEMCNPDGLVAPQGIYEFQKDLLVICLATTDGFRPTEFKSG
jgi:hypothetical protein